MKRLLIILTLIVGVPAFAQTLQGDFTNAEYCAELHQDLIRVTNSINAIQAQIPNLRVANQTLQSRQVPDTFRPNIAIIRRPFLNILLERQEELLQAMAENDCFFIDDKLNDLLDPPIMQTP